MVDEVIRHAPVGFTLTFEEPELVPLSLLVCVHHLEFSARCDVRQFSGHPQILPFETLTLRQGMTPIFFDLLFRLGINTPSLTHILISFDIPKHGMQVDYLSMTRVLLNAPNLRLITVHQRGTFYFSLLLFVQ
jgi:hypothetical protein